MISSAVLYYLENQENPFTGEPDIESVEDLIKDDILAHIDEINTTISDIRDINTFLKENELCSQDKNSYDILKSSLEENLKIKQQELILSTKNTNNVLATNIANLITKLDTKYRVVGSIYKKDNIVASKIINKAMSPNQMLKIFEVCEQAYAMFTNINIICGDDDRFLSTGLTELLQIFTKANYEVKMTNSKIFINSKYEEYETSLRILGYSDKRVQELFAELSLRMKEVNNINIYQMLNVCRSLVRNELSDFYEGSLDTFSKLALCESRLNILFKAIYSLLTMMNNTLNCFYKIVN